MKLKILLMLVMLVVTFMTAACSPLAPGDAELTKNVKVELIDWHISGLMVINSPVAWVRVSNYNTVTIKDITFDYDTFDEHGQPIDHGTFTIQDTVYPGEVRNFVELYIGLVDLRTEALRIKLVSVTRG